MHLINGDHPYVFRVGETNWIFGQIQFPKIMGVYTVQEVIWALKRNGWKQVRWRGDHRQFRCKGNRYVVTVAGQLHADVKRGILKNIERLSGLNFNEILG